MTGGRAALADLALRHALEQEAARIVGPSYEGLDFPTPNNATATGWRHSPGRASWNGGVDEDRAAVSDDWDARDWTGALAYGAVGGGAGADRRLAMADLAGDWDLTFEFRIWEPPEPGQAAAARGRVTLRLPPPGQTPVYRTEYRTSGQWEDETTYPVRVLTGYRPAYHSFTLRLRGSNGTVLQDLRVSNSGGTTQTVDARTVATGAAGNALRAGDVLTVETVSGPAGAEASVATNFTGGGAAADPTHLGPSWDGWGAADRPVAFRRPPDRGIAVRRPRRRRARDRPGGALALPARARRRLRDYRRRRLAGRVDVMILEEAIRRVEAAAEAARLHWIAPGAGQALLYRRKTEEAERLRAAAGTPEPAADPILAASVGIEAADLAGVADVVIARRDAWTAVAARIEAVRQQAKADPRAAPPSRREALLTAALERLAAIHPGAAEPPEAV